MKRAIIWASGLLLASSFAFAGGDKLDKSFKDLDTNRDGAITRSEASASQALSAKFAAADTNMDGKLESREFSQIEKEIEEAE